MKPASSPETDLPHAIIEVFGSSQNFDFHPHKIDGQVAAINFWKAHRVLLRCNDRVCLPFLATIHRVQHFLLRETMMIRESFGVDQLRAQVYQAPFEGFWLGNSAERGHFLGFKEIQTLSLARENILEIEGMMNAFDYAGCGIMPGNAGSELRGVSI